MAVMDPILSLAMSMQSSKGVYALLLGSGVSRDAGIPTGWEIQLDLINQLAVLRGEEPPLDPVVWYETHFKKPPDYSDLLDQLTTTPSLRAEKLRSYFVPTEEERADRRKIPTAAHEAIARLAADGFIRVIVTTNFDRLMEQALDARGVYHTVISTGDAVAGAVPLIHAKCCVVKVHGDYGDTRIKNTKSELAAYDEHIDHLLDRVFDDFGLIVCGWSAEWDEALRRAVERCPSRRFPTYWVARDRLSDQAKHLIAHRNAEVIRGQTADIFFVDLSEKVLALDSFLQTDPLSTRVAVARMKKYLEGNHSPITLHDFVMNEVDRVCSALSPERFAIDGISLSNEELVARIQQYDTLTDTLVALFAAGLLLGWEREECAVGQVPRARRESAANTPQFSTGTA